MQDKIDLEKYFKDIKKGDVITIKGDEFPYNLLISYLKSNNKNFE